MVKKIIVFLISFILIFEQSGFAQVATPLGIPAYLNGYLNPDRFRPMHLRSLSYDALSNNFDILLDKGDIKDLKPVVVQDTTQKLLEYFKIGISLPNSMFWVNLRPDSEKEIIDPDLEKTDLGKVLLEADLQLKKDLAGLTSPDNAEGRLYWDKLYAKAESMFGRSDIEIPTLTRPWIVPGEIIIRQSSDTAYVYKATLKVMLEQDYLKDTKGYEFDDPRLKELNEFSSDLIRKLIIPKLTRQVNSSKKYSQLRQVYYSLILSQWFKQQFRGKQGEYSGQIDKKDLTGLTSKIAWSKDTYFKAYQKSFKNGEYDRQDTSSDVYGGLSIRRYFSGGIIPVAKPGEIVTISKGPNQVAGPDLLGVQIKGNEFISQDLTKAIADGGSKQAEEKEPGSLSSILSAQQRIPDFASPLLVFVAPLVIAGTVLSFTNIVFGAIAGAVTFFVVFTLVMMDGNRQNQKLSEMVKDGTYFSALMTLKDWDKLRYNKAAAESLYSMGAKKIYGQLKKHGLEGNTVDVFTQIGSGISNKEEIEKQKNLFASLRHVLGEREMTQMVIKWLQGNHYDAYEKVVDLMGNDLPREIEREIEMKARHSLESAVNRFRNEFMTRRYTSPSGSFNFYDEDVEKVKREARVLGKVGNEETTVFLGMQLAKVPHTLMFREDTLILAQKESLVNPMVPAITGAIKEIQSRSYSKQNKGSLRDGGSDRNIAEEINQVRKQNRESEYKRAADEASKSKSVFYLTLLATSVVAAAIFAVAFAVPAVATLSISTIAVPIGSLGLLGYLAFRTIRSYKVYSANLARPNKLKPSEQNISEASTKDGGTVESEISAIFESTEESLRNLQATDPNLLGVYNVEVKEAVIKELVALGGKWGPAAVVSALRSSVRSQTLSRQRVCIEEAIVQLDKQATDGGDINAAVEAVTIGKSEVPRLVEALSHYSSRVRSAAAGELDRLEELTPERKLIRYAADLTDPDIRVRLAATEALKESGELTEERQVVRFVADLSDQDSKVRSAAFDGLAKLNKLTPTLMKIRYVADLADPDPEVRLPAIEAESTIGKDAVPLLVESLSHPDSRIRIAAAQELDRLEELTPKRQLIRYAADVTDPDKDVRLAATEALGKISDPKAVKSLLKALSDPDIDVSRTAAEALVKIRDPRVVKLLLRDLVDPDKDVRLAAAEALKGLGELTEERQLIRFVADLDDPDKDVRLAAAVALGKTGSSQAVDGLGKALDDPDRDVALAAVEALKNIGHPRAIQHLHRVLGKYGFVVAVALQHLVREVPVEKKTAFYIEDLANLNGEIQLAAVEGLVRIGQPAVASLLKALSAPYGDVRRVATEALVKIGQPAVAPLLKVLTDPNSNIRRVAAEVLGNIGDPKATDPLLKALEDINKDVGRAAAAALVKIGKPAVPRLMELSRDVVIGPQVMQILGQIGSNEGKKDGGEVTVKDFEDFVNNKDGLKDRFIARNFSEEATIKLFGFGLNSALRTFKDLKTTDTSLLKSGTDRFYADKVIYFIRQEKNKEDLSDISDRDGGKIDEMIADVKKEISQNKIMAARLYGISDLMKITPDKPLVITADDGEAIEITYEMLQEFKKTNFPKVLQEYDSRGKDGFEDKENPENFFTKEVLVLLGISLATAEFASHHGTEHLNPGDVYAMAGDNGPSTPKFRKYLSIGIRAAGVNALDLGLVNSGQLYSSIFSLGLQGGLYVTRSHVEVGTNGFKPIVGKTTLYGDMIQELGRQVDKGLRIVDKQDQGVLIDGTAKDKGIGKTVKDIYVAKIKEEFGPLIQKVKEKNIPFAVDLGSGSATTLKDIIKEIFGDNVLTLRDTPVENPTKIRGLADPSRTDSAALDHPGS